MAQISGDLTTIEQTIRALKQSDSIWLEIVYTGDEIVSDLREQVQAMVEGLPCEVLKIKNTRTYNKVLNQQQTSENLQDLNEMEVFERCLTLNDVADSQKDSLRDAYGQILYNLRHEDKQAE
ncbi:exonuclease SbcD [Psychrobacter sp. JCM 18900]|nr:exonuclease SbcD [Psychrobacter sp. JCM 18900]